MRLNTNSKSVDFVHPDKNRKLLYTHYTHTCCLTPKNVDACENIWCRTHHKLLNGMRTAWCAPVTSHCLHLLREQESTFLDTEVLRLIRTVRIVNNECLAYAPHAMCFRCIIHTDFYSNNRISWTIDWNYGSGSLILLKFMLLKDSQWNSIQSNPITSQTWILNPIIYVFIYDNEMQHSLILIEMHRTFENAIFIFSIGIYKCFVYDCEWNCHHLLHKWLQLNFLFWNKFKLALIETKL